MKPDAPSLPGDMLTLLMLGLLSFTLLFAGVFLLRYALETLRDAADARERRVTT
jgi:hypothetical protein